MAVRLQLVEVTEEFQIILTDRAHHVLKRWSGEDSISEVKELENVINDFLRDKIYEYQRTDGPIMAAKYEALDDKLKQAVDDILSEGTSNAE